MSILRKDEHIKYAALTSGDFKVFKDIHILYNSIPELDYNHINTDTKIMGRTLSYPIIINAMTGGSKCGREINEVLSRIAAEFNIPIAAGSQSIAIKDKSLRDTFTVMRKNNKNGFIMANIGAGASLISAKQAVDMIEADALQLHLNVLQELIMEEGDRDFTGILENIINIKENVDVPVMVKEVGFGMTGDTAARLTGAGIDIIDIGGYGGTNFAKIESLRKDKGLYSDLCSIGIPTAVSLYEVCRLKPQIEVICGGGIRSGLDIAKAIIMGARAVSIAHPFLRIFLDKGYEGISEHMKRLIDELKISMAAAGAVNLEELHHKKVVITGRTLEWIKQL